MRNKLLAFAGAAVIAAGMLFAQTGSAPVPSQPSGPGMQRHGFGRARMFGHLARRLNLTDTQRQQARGIFQDMRTQAQPIRDQVRQGRQALVNAAIAGKSADELSQLAQAQAPQLAQLAALRAQAFAKFYAMLTPDQQQQFQTMRSRWAAHTGAPAAQSAPEAQN
ncbi:MAG TPA: Spy/CpxP family protein refolding chaperone [Bryobacteraceae bacterium]|nr:Spy/CpxP family protein refolding chaperone [Bryobacteraceae bacterium]